MPAMPEIPPGAAEDPAFEARVLRAFIMVDGGYATRTGMVYRRVPPAVPPREVPAGPPLV
jgi:hypothetical protein